MVAALKKYGVVISRLPIVQSGLVGIMKDNFPEYDLSAHQRIEQLTLLQLHKANLVLVDLSGEGAEPKALFEHYYSLMVHYQNIHWVFMVSQASYPLAVEFLLRPQSMLLSEAEPVPHLISAIQELGKQTSHLSTALISPDSLLMDDIAYRLPALDKKVHLTLSERQVLRLIAKGWGVNQIALLLRKSNKTISAQKNSAMRRLALRGNAEMYAWINSSQGMKELNLLSARGEPTQWKSIPQADMSLS